MSSIIETLQSQRTMLVDVVRQIDVALGAFGATNGNGTTPNGNGKVHWTQRVSASRRAKIARKAARTRAANRAARTESVTTL